MFQLTEEMVAYWKHLPDNACISGAELSKATGLDTNRIGGLVKSGHLPVSGHIIPKHIIGNMSRRKYWKLKELRQFAKLGRDEYMVQKRDNIKRRELIKAMSV